MKLAASLIFLSVADQICVVTDLLSFHAEFLKQFSDNPSFRKWLADTVFSETYGLNAGA